MATQETTLSADGNTDWLEWHGGSGIFDADGTFGSGTAKLQFTDDNGSTAKDVPDMSFTSDNAKRFTIDHPCKVRVNLSGSTSPTVVVGIRQ